MVCPGCGKLLQKLLHGFCLLPKSLSAPGAGFRTRIFDIAELIRRMYMYFRPLHDRVLVRRIDAEEKTAGGIIIPDTAKEKPQEGEIVAAGPGGRNEQGQLRSDRCEGRGSGVVRQVVRHRSEDRRRGLPDHEGERSSGRRRKTSWLQEGAPDVSKLTVIEKGDLKMAAKDVKFSTEARERMLRGRGHTGKCGEGHAGSERAQRRHREIVRGAAHHQGRRNSRQGNRA